MITEILQRLARRSTGAGHAFEERVDKLSFGASVAHMNCGAGDLTFSFAEGSHYIEGVDPRRDKIRIAIEKLRLGDHENVNFTCRPIADTKFSGANFDLVFGVDILATDAGVAAMEARRLLRTGGALVTLERGWSGQKSKLIEAAFPLITMKHFGALNRLTLIEATKGPKWA